MRELEDLPELNRPIVIAAFEGWNDAGEAATAAVSHLAEVWEADKVIAYLDPEDYYDFQVNRPRIVTENGERRISWPLTRVQVAQDAVAGRDVILIHGIEPSMRWTSFCAEIIAYAESAGAEQLIMLGALLGDVPHTRPLQVHATSEDADLRRRFDLERSQYDGPTGIVGVLTQFAAMQELPALSAWVPVPHYAGSSPSPKATEALVAWLEKALDGPIPRGELEEMSRAWMNGVNELASTDEEVAEYIQALEQAQDAFDLPEATGDAIAQEFERYLRRRGENG